VGTIKNIKNRKTHDIFFDMKQPDQGLFEAFRSIEAGVEGG